MGARSISPKAVTSKQLAKLVVKYADDMKALDIVILDMRKLVNFCDYFVIATGTSDRHVKSIAEGVNDDLTALGIHVHKPKHIKGFGAASPDSAEGAWVLFDLGDVVAHVFEPKAREFYGLEHLWQDAPKVK